jgi:hypothetical protein
MQLNSSLCQIFCNITSMKQLGLKTTCLITTRSDVRKRSIFPILVVGNQIGSLTLNPSFAHNLGCRCSNCQCEVIFDIYVSRPFQWHQEHPNARCFGPCCRALNIRESRRTPNPNFSKCWASPHTWPKWGCDTLIPNLNYIFKKINIGRF